MSTDARPRHPVYDAVGKFWPVFVALTVFVSGLWLASNLHEREIRDLKAADVEIRSEIKELRTEQTASNKLVADALGEIRVQLKEVVTTLRFALPKTGAQP